MDRRDQCKLAIMGREKGGGRRLAECLDLWHVTSVEVIGSVFLDGNPVLTEKNGARNDSTPLLNSLAISLIPWSEGAKTW